MRITKDCETVIPGCSYCGQSYYFTTQAKTSKRVAYFVCFSCKEGLYLYQNTSTSYDTSIIYSACVPDCQVISPTLMNDEYTGACISCGTNCRDCNYEKGCSSCYTGSAQRRSILATPTSTSLYFKNQCNNCANSYICNQCDTPNTNLTCQTCAVPFQSTLCLSSTTFTKSIDKYTNPAGVSICLDQALYRSGLGVCTACAQQNCLYCASPTDCNYCNSGYTKISNPGLCTSCNPVSQLYQDCETCTSIFDCSLCYNGFSYNGQCLTKCPTGYYGLRTYGTIRGRVTAATCQACDPSCKSCIGGLATECKTCFKDYYLATSSVQLQYGSCLQKTDGTPAQTVIYKQAAISSYSASSLQGTYALPYDQLEDAIERAYELAAPFRSASITILLEKGMHFEVRSYTYDRYNPQNIDKESNNLQLTIRPLYCAENTGALACSSTPNANEVTVINKRAGFFVIWVSASLTIQDIIIDSLDSIFSYNFQTSAMEENCVSAFSRCCKIDTNGDIANDASQICIYWAQYYYLRSPPNEDCYISQGEAVFRFQKSANTLLTTSPPSLTIQNCQFKNFYYDFNSFIEVHEWGAHITITDTTFDKISSCGSVIRNFYVYSDPTIFNQTVFAPSTYLEYQDITKRLLGYHKTMRETRYSVATASPWTCTTNQLDTTTTQCFKIEITRTTFENFGKYKLLSKPTIVNENVHIRYHGQILNLKNFLGQVSIIDSTFQKNYLMYGDCSAGQYMQSATDLNDVFQFYGGRKHTQIKNLVSIRGTSHKITIAGNTFSYNSGIKGLVYIDSPHRTQAVLITQNNFTLNSAYYGAVGIFVRARGFITSTTTTINPSSESDLQCGGYLFQQNHYEKNYACPRYGESVVEFECVGSADTSGYNDQYTYASPYSQTQSQLLDYQGKFAQYKAISFSTTDTITYKGTDYAIHLNKVSFNQNTYLQNYGSGNSGILSIRGVQLPEILQETFTNNGDSYDELADLIGGHFIQIKIYTLASLYSQTMNGVLNLDYVFYPKIQQLTFDGGFKLSSTFTSNKAQLIMVSNSRGPIEISNCVFKNQKGLGFDPITTVDDDLSKMTNYLADLSLISFDQSIISQYELLDLTFQDIIIKGYQGQSSYTKHPYIIGPDLGASRYFYESQPTVEYSTKLLTIQRLKITNVDCTQCANFKFMFAVQDFQIIESEFTNINNPSGGISYLAELSQRSGIFGIVQHPLFSQTYQCLQSNTFTNIQGSAIRLYVTYNPLGSLKPEFIFQNNTISSIYQNEDSGGVIVFQSDLLETSVTLNFIENQVNTVKQMSQLTSQEGGIIYARNLDTFKATLNVISNTILYQGSGDIFYLINTQGDLNAVLDSNIFLIQDNPVSETNKIAFLSSLSQTFTNSAPISILQQSATASNLYINAKNNTFSNSDQKVYGGFFYISNIISIGITTEFIDYQSVYKYGYGFLGGSIHCIMCTSISMLETKVYDSFAKNGAVLYLSQELATQQYQPLTLITNCDIQRNKAIDSGGVIYTIEKNSISKGSQLINPKFIIAQSTIKSNSAHYLSTTVNQGYGGVIFADNDNIEITLDSTILDLNEAQQGGIMYIRSSTTVSTTSSTIVFQNGTKVNNSYSTSLLGSVLDFNSYKGGTVNIIGGFFDQSLLLTSGQLFNLQGSTYCKISVFIKTEVTYFQSIKAISAQGCIFKLNQASVNDLSGTIYQDVQCSEGGIYHLTTSNIQIQQALFTRIFSTTGGILSTSKDTDSYYVFDNCVFDDITADYSGLINDLAACTQSRKKIIQNSKLQNIKIAKSTALSYLSSIDCINEYKDLIIFNITITQQITKPDLASFIKIIDSKSMTLSNVKVDGFLQALTNQESFLYSEASGIDIKILTSNFQCQNSYNNDLNFVTFNTLFQIQNAKLVTSTENKANYCNMAFQGLFYLIEVTGFIDKYSVYQNNTSSTSGIYNIYAASDVKSIIDIELNEYKYITGRQSGVIVIYNYFDLIFNENIVGNNIGNKGGILQISTQYNNNNNSTVEIQKIIFFNNSAINQGGVIFIDHPKLNINIKYCTFQYNYAQIGGVFYVQFVQEFLFSQNNIMYNFANSSTISYSNAPNSYYDMEDNVFLGLEKYDYQAIVSSLDERLFNSSNSMYFSSTTSIIKSKHNTYQNFYFNQRGGVYSFDGATFSEEESTYKNNSAILGSVYSCSKCKITSLTNVYQYNIGYEGGVFYIESDSTMQSSFDSFDRNSALSNGGVIIITTRSTMNMLNSKFTNNQALSDSVLTALKTSQDKPFKIRGCQFLQNIADTNMMSLKEANGLIQTSLFLNNKANSQSNNLIISFSVVNITESTFQDTTIVNQEQFAKNTNIQGSYISISIGANVLVANSNFSNGTSQLGGAIYINGLSSITIINVRFTKNYARQSGGAIFSSGHQAVNVVNSQFRSNFAKERGGEFYGTYSKEFAYFENVQIYDSAPISSIFMDSASFSSFKLTINANLDRAVQGAAITCINCDRIDIQSSEFYNQRSQIGGAIYIAQSDDVKVNTTKPTYTIESSIFQFCNSYQGGALYIGNPENMVLRNLTFKNNTAFNNTNNPLSGLGGGIHYTCSSSFKCNVLLSNTRCIFNYADNSGGCIKWDDVEPVFENNVYQNNTAVLYGPNIASFGQKLMRISKTQYNNQINRWANKQANSTKKRFLQQAGTQQDKDLIQVGVIQQRSGGVLPQLYLALADKYNTIVGNTNSAVLNVRVDQYYNLKYPKSTQFNPNIEGIKQLRITGGVFNVTQLLFTATPTYEYKVLFETDGIDMSKPSNKQFLNTTLFANYTAINFQMYVGLRECIAGEALSETGKCVPCAYGTLYQLDSLTHNGKCVDCPKEAICFGGSIIGPKPGYWREDNITLVFIQCPNPKACLGISPPNFNQQGDCVKSYQGLLCTECDVGFQRSYGFECKRCPNKTANAIRMIGIFIAIILFAIILIKQNQFYAMSFSYVLKAIGDKESKLDIYIKILINHMHLIVLTAFFGLSWPDLVWKFQRFFNPLGLIVEEIISFDCFINEFLDLDPSYRIFYLKLIVFACLPIFIFLVCYCVVVPMTIKHKDWNLIQNRAITSIVVLMFIVLPNIIIYCLQAFRCYPYGDESRVYEDLEIKCYTEVHTVYAFSVAFPSLLVWGLVIPILLLIYLIKNRLKLDEDFYKMKIGFIYRGYKQKYFFYEIVIFFRKFVMIIIVVFLKSVGVVTQSLVVFCFLIFFLIFNLQQRPFMNSTFNNLETISLISSIITIYFGIFFISDPSSVYTEQQQDQTNANTSSQVLPGWGKQIFFTFIILAHLIFFAFWIVKMFFEIKLMLLRKYTKIYLILFNCNNKEKLEKDQKAQQVKDKQQSIMESYSSLLHDLKDLNKTKEVDEDLIRKLKNRLNKQRRKSIVGMNKNQLQWLQEYADEQEKKKRSKSDSPKGGKKRRLKQRVDSINGNDNTRDQLRTQTSFKSDATQAEGNLIVHNHNLAVGGLYLNTPKASSANIPYYEKKSEDHVEQMFFNGSPSSPVTKVTPPSSQGKSPKSMHRRDIRSDTNLKLFIIEETKEEDVPEMKMNFNKAKDSEKKPQLKLSERFDTVRSSDMFLDSQATDGNFSVWQHTGSPQKLTSSNMGDFEEAYVKELQKNNLKRRFSKVTPDSVQSETDSNQMTSEPQNSTGGIWSRFTKSVKKTFGFRKPSKAQSEFTSGEGDLHSYPNNTNTDNMDFERNEEEKKNIDYLQQELRIQSASQVQHENSAENDSSDDEDDLRRATVVLGESPSNKSRNVITA